MSIFQRLPNIALVQSIKIIKLWNMDKRDLQVSPLKTMRGYFVCILKCENSTNAFVSLDVYMYMLLIRQLRTPKLVMSV